MEQQQPGLATQRSQRRADEQTYEPAELDKMAAGLRALPAMDPSKRRTNKQGAVRYLAKEIAAVQARGYTVEEIVESLHGLGLDITTPTLKSYLQRAKNRAAKGSKARRRSTDAGKEAAAPSALRPEPLPKSAAASTPGGALGNRTAMTAKGDGPASPTPERAPLRAGKDAFLITDKDSY